MAFRNTNPTAHQQVGIVRCSGRFRTNGGSALNLAEGRVEGVGYTPSRVAAGQYRVTLDQVGKALVACGAQLMLNASADLKIEVGPYDAANKRIDFFVTAVAVATDPADNANNWISWWAEFQDTKIRKGSKKL